MSDDYYGVLGVPRDADTDEIKRAFRRVARESHPDANPGDPLAEARFRRAAEAYEVLSDPARRRRYDRGDTIELGDILSGFGGFEDLLRGVFGDGGLFGASPPRQGPQRGSDILVVATVDLAAAVFGTETDVEFSANASCDLCGGSGAQPGTHPETCPTCRGAGTVRVARRSVLGSMMSVTTCSTCRGAGRIIPDPCERCWGNGVVESARSVTVEVPPGVTGGTRLRLTGRGAAGLRGGPPGDLYVELVVSPHADFVRDGDDLVHRLRIDMVEAALGSEAKVPLIDGGEELLTIPAATQPGAVLRIGGKGASRLGRRGRGDLIVRVDVAVPKNLSEEEEEALRAYAEARGRHVLPPRRGFRRRRS
jgi:molecular chaperone DnaJ